MKTRFCVLAVVALVAYGLKRHYAGAPVDALAWMLAPTAWLVGLVTGTPFTAVPDEGYLSVERLFLIEKACAGINFMIAAFAMVAFTLLHRVRTPRAGAAVVVASLTASYAAAVIVNTVRIVIAMAMAAHPVAIASLTAADIHRLEGIAVYFGGLLVLYELVRRIDRGSSGATYALPLGCYYLVTLVLPIANGAAGAAGQGSEAFLTHALVVLLIPPVLIALVLLAKAPDEALPPNLF